LVGIYIKKIIVYLTVKTICGMPCYSGTSKIINYGELKYEAKKEGTTTKKVEAAKKATGSNKRAAVEKNLEGKK
jgi:hypothetical protein